MDDFLEFIKDCFGNIGAVTAKRMFGGIGVYLNSKIIGIIDDGEFYIKANPEAVDVYIKQGLKQFSYEREGKIFYMKYFVLEDEILENPDILKEYANRAY